MVNNRKLKASGNCCPSSAPAAIAAQLLNLHRIGEYSYEGAREKNKKNIILVSQLLVRDEQRQHARRAPTRARHASSLGHDALKALIGESTWLPVPFGVGIPAVSILFQTKVW